MSHESDEQLTVDQSATEELGPKYMWRTLLGRAVFGFYAETYRSDYFVSDAYLQRLCDVENAAANNYARVILYSVLFSIFSIATANNALGEAAWLGFTISGIPFLTEFCVVILGFSVALLVFNGLEIHALSRMRQELFSVTGSENPNMRMVHWKGSGAWLDALIPKTVGYSSNWVHRLFQVFGLIWAFSLPLFVTLIVVLGQVVCIVSSPPIFELSLSSILLWSGIFLSGSSLLILFLVSFVPVKFTLGK